MNDAVVCVGLSQIGFFVGGGGGGVHSQILCICNGMRQLS